MSASETSFERLVATGHNVCLTGPGGTGKSHRIRRLIASDPDRFAVTASTGIAAINVGGHTLHRWSGMMLGPQNGESNEDCFAHLLSDKRFTVRAGFNRIREACTLVIDEISMITGRTLDFLDFLCRRIRACNEPFGGIQVIVTGDLHQSDLPFSPPPLGEVVEKLKGTSGIGALQFTHGDVVRHPLVAAILKKL